MIGQQFGNYRAISLLGEGGMGAVYLAEHPAIGRRVAVKVLHKNYIRDENLLTRFLNEARAANAIRHPNIIEILDSGTIADGTPFLVMELLEGESLGTRIRRDGALPIQTAVEFCYQTASALGAAHKKGIVHRDLKPDNLFVVPDPHEPERERIKVLDFGIAKLQQSANDSVKTRTGTLMGTPIYMSPEQCRGTRTVDHRSDIYSLGIIFFEMLCGQPPFVSEGFGELVNMHLNVAPPAPSSQNANVSPTIDAIVLKMLSKNPDDRFADMGSLMTALKSSGGSMFVVRSAQPSSPDIARKTDKPASSSNTGQVGLAGSLSKVGAGSVSNPKLHDTTFSTGVGERVGGTQSGGPQSPKKGKAALVFVVAAAAAVGVGVFIFRDGEKAGVEREIASAPSVPATPATTTAPKIEAPAPPPAAPIPAPPAVPKTVTVRVESDPTGANVLDDASGGVLGVTPLVLTRPHGGAFKVRLEKDGYTPNAHAISLDDDQTIELTLEHKQIKPAHVHKPHAPSGGDSEPAKL
jgi:serine/threonine-protein kinase